MADELGWAARYQFLDELWRGHDRLVFDPELEGLLRTGGRGFGHGSHDSIVELSEALLPTKDSEEEVWVALSNPRRGAEYARARGGTTFLSVEEAAALAAEEDWEVAIVNLAGALADAPAPSSVRSTASLVEARLDPRVRSLVEVLAEFAPRDRSVVLSVPGQAGGGLDYAGVSELVAAVLPEARIYGVGQSPSVAVYDFGFVEEASASDVPPDGEEEADEDGEAAAYDADLDAAEQEWTGEFEAEEEQVGGVALDPLAGEEEEEEDEEDVPIDFDNSLGELEPAITAWLVIDTARSLSEGLTLIEMPRDAAGTATGAVSVAAQDERGLAAQLAQAQRQSDLAAIERQRLMEALEEAEDQLAALDDEGGGARSRSASAEVDTAERLDAALAREQTLRWQVSQLQTELTQARARPVEELEAELAEVRARLAASDASLEESRTQSRTEGDSQSPRPQAQADVEANLSPTAASGRSEADRAKLRASVDTLLARLERGGLPTMELHQQLRRLRQLL